MGGLRINSIGFRLCQFIVVGAWLSLPVPEARAGVTEACGNNKSCAACFNAFVKAKAYSDFLASQINTAVAAAKAKKRRYADEHLCGLLFKGTDDAQNLADRAKSVCASADVIPDLRRWSVELAQHSRTTKAQMQNGETYEKCLQEASLEGKDGASDKTKDAGKSGGACERPAMDYLSIKRKKGSAYVVENGCNAAIYFVYRAQSHVNQPEVLTGNVNSNNRFDVYSEHGIEPKLLGACYVNQAGCSMTKLQATFR